jgi:hypothetical protein
VKRYRGGRRRGRKSRASEDRGWRWRAYDRRARRQTYGTPFTSQNTMVCMERQLVYPLPLSAPLRLLSAIVADVADERRQPSALEEEAACSAWQLHVQAHGMLFSGDKGRRDGR